MTKLYYQSLAEFNHQFYKDLLNTEHLEGGQVNWQVKNVHDEDDKESFLGYVFNKEEKNYLVPFEKGNIKQNLPIEVLESDMVSYRGTVYHLVRNARPCYFEAKKQMSFKEFVDTLSSLEHTNPDHQRLLVMMGLTQLLGRANYRVCSPPGSGKTSVPSMMSSLFGGAYVMTLEPTVAKLEMRAYSEWLVLDEVMDIPEAERKRMEQFFLGAGALQPTIEKHSRAYGNVDETIDISKLSLSIFHNDITDYSLDPDKYFDNLFKRAVVDRFPAMRIHGHYTERWNKINEINVREQVADNMDFYKDLVYTYEYFKKHLEDEVHGYDHSFLEQVYPLLKEPWMDRTRTNIGALLKIVDVYSSTKDEFQRWCVVIAETLRDYQAMLSYPGLEERAKKKYGPKRWPELKERVDKANTFTEKNQLLQSDAPQEQRLTDVSGVWD